MGESSYFELLQDPRWQRRKTEILTRDEFQCQWCHATNVTLHVHHQFYVRSRMPWDYRDEQLVTLCRDCHDVASEQHFYLRFILSRMSPRDFQRVCGMVAFMVGDESAIALMSLSKASLGTDEDDF